MEKRRRAMGLLLSLAVVLVMMTAMTTVVWGDGTQQEVKPIIRDWTDSNGIYGTGTLNDPWRIETGKQLVAFSNEVNDGAQTFKAIVIP